MKLSELDFTKPNLPRLTAEKKKSDARGLSAVKSSLQNLFRKEKEQQRVVSLSPLARIKNSLTQFFHKKSNVPRVEKKLTTVENKTEVYSMQPSRRYMESVSQSKAMEKMFTPEYLIREAPKEITTPLPDEKKRLLFANLHLELKGVLKRRPDGLCYLSLSEKLFAELSELFYCEGFSLPDFDLRIGPSISVILPHENPLGILFELDREYRFTIKRALLVTQYDWPGVDKTLILTLNSTELMQVRQSHGLTERPNGRDFHLTLGLQKSGQPFQEKGFMRVHVGYHPA